MDPSSLTPVLRILRGCLHLLLGALLTLSIVRAVQERVPHLMAVVVLAVVLGVVYAVGATWPRVRHSGAIAAGWLVAVWAVWTALLVVSPEAVYLAFPLFFLEPPSPADEVGHDGRCRHDRHGDRWVQLASGRF